MQNMTVEELKTLKMNLLGGMNSFILATGTPVTIKTWQSKVLPKNCTEQDLERIADDIWLWEQACSTFGGLTKA